MAKSGCYIDVVTGCNRSQRNDISLSRWKVRLTTVATGWNINFDVLTSSLCARQSTSSHYNSRPARSFYSFYLTCKLKSQSQPSFYLYYLSAPSFAQRETFRVRWSFLLFFSKGANCRYTVRFSLWILGRDRTRARQWHISTTLNNILPFI